MRNTSSNNLSIEDSFEPKTDEIWEFTHLSQRMLVAAICCLILVLPMTAMSSQADATSPVEQDGDSLEASVPAPNKQEISEAKGEPEEEESSARESKELGNDEESEPKEHLEGSMPSDGETPEPDVSPEVSAEPMAIDDEADPIEEETDASPKDTSELDSVEQPSPSQDEPEDLDLSELDPAWRLYHEAFIHLAGDQPLEAVATLSHLRITYGDHPAAALAREALHFVEATTIGTPSPPPLEPIPDERVSRTPFYMEEATNTARAELATFQTLHGIVLAVQLALLAEVSTERPVMAMAMMGGGLGLGLSLWSTASGITSGQSQAINTGTMWGAWNAGAMSILLDRLVDPLPYNAGLGLLMAGQVGGIAAGAYLWNRWGPHAGEITVASSTGIWSGALTAMLLGIMAPGIDDDLRLATLLVMSDLGLLSGALLSRHIQMSRSRANIINLSGGLGTFIGFVTAIFFDVFDTQVMLGFTTLGALGGLALGLHFTEGWDHDRPTGRTSRSAGNESALRLNLMPMNDGAALVFSRDI